MGADAQIVVIVKGQMARNGPLRVDGSYSRPKDRLSVGAELANCPVLIH